MAGPWNASNRPAAGAAASVSITAPAQGSPTKLQVRLRQLWATLAGTAAGSDTLTVWDGPVGTGTIIWQGDLSVPAGGGDRVVMVDVDLRASPGNALTIAFGAGVATDQESVNASGDMVPVGYPMFQS